MGDIGGELRGRGPGFIGIGVVEGVDVGDIRNGSTGTGVVEPLVVKSPSKSISG